MGQHYGEDPSPAPGSRLDQLARRQRAWRRKAFRVVLTLATITAVAVLAVREFAGDGTATQATKQDPGQQPTATATALSGQQPGGEAIAAAIAECRTAWQLQSASRAAAKRSLAQWRVHIDAMNQLSAGKLTLDQATQFWAQSRSGAKANAAAFRAATRQYRTSRARCEVPAEATGDTRPVAQCHDAVVAASKELNSADVAIKTWETHIEHMEMLRAGRLDPSHALHLWIQNWRSGAAQVAAYDKATSTTVCAV